MRLDTHVLKALLFMGIATSTAASAQTATVNSDQALIVHEASFSTASLARADAPLFFQDSSIGGHQILAYPAVMGPIEKIDLPANQLIVAGQFVSMEQLRIDDFSLGDYIRVDGLVSAKGVTNPQISRLDTPYVYGASLSYFVGFVSRSNGASATAKVGVIDLDYSNALSRALESSYQVVGGDYVRAIGIQSLNSQFIAADLQTIPSEGLGAASSDSNTTQSTKAMLGVAYNSKATIGGSRITKAIIGGNRSTKVIIGGNRATKAIIGGNRSTKVIIGGNRATKAIIGSNRSTKVIIGGNRATKAIIGVGRSNKVIIGGARSKAIISADENI